MTRFPDGAGELGEFLSNMLGGTPEPGPPYVHTLTAPEPEYDDDGNEIYVPRPPTYTLTEIPLADLVDPDPVKSLLVEQFGCSFEDATLPVHGVKV